MKKINYIIPQTEVMDVNTLLMQQLQDASGSNNEVTTDPNHPAPGRNKLFY